MFSLISRLTAFVLCALLAMPVLAAGGGGGGGDGPGGQDPAKQTGAYKQAMDAIQAERYAQAIPILENWVAGHSNDADAFNWLGFGYRKTGKLDPPRPTSARLASTHSTGAPTGTSARPT